MLKEIETAFDTMLLQYQDQDLWQGAITALRALEGLLHQLPTQVEEVVQATAKPAFERLTQLFQLACLVRYRDEDSVAWIDPACHYLLGQLEQGNLEFVAVPSLEEIEVILGWQLDELA
jgi:hypothetical protein